MSELQARSWADIIEDEDAQFVARYDSAILMIAMLQANRVIEAREEAGEEIPDSLRPDISDEEAVIQQVIEGSKPPWWPSRLERVQVKITCHADGETKENFPAFPVDPNTRGLGRKVFESILKRTLEGQGEPFEGRVKIVISQASDGTTLSSWRGRVYVADKEKKKSKKASGDREESITSERYDEMREENKEMRDNMMRMFTNASGVIHASASAINATRGVNMAPPWLQEGQNDETPIWMALLGQIPGMLAASGLLGGQGNPSQAIGQMMSHPVRGPGAISPYGGQQPRQLPGPDLGYNQYNQTGGQYDGYHVDDSDMLDDGFESASYDDDFIGEEDEDEDDEDFEYDEDEDEEDEAPRSRKSGNPLDGMSPQELSAYLNEYIDKNPDKKAQIKQMGMGLAAKIL